MSKKLTTEEFIKDCEAKLREITQQSAVREQKIDVIKKESKRIKDAFGRIK